MNRKERRAARKPKVGDMIWTETFLWATGEFYWVRVPDRNMTKEEAVQTQEWHGPFKTYAEAEEDQYRVLVPGMEVRKGGKWDPAWDKVQ